MNETDETLEQIPERNEILKAIAELSKKIDNLQKETQEYFHLADIQFEAIREGIVYNGAKFDRLEAAVYSSRSDVANLRADIKELTEEIHQMKKESVM